MSDCNYFTVRMEALKLQDLTMLDLKLTDQIAGVECREPICGVENDRPEK